jgi:hypothetical protein
VEEGELLETLMPNDLCARCDDAEPAFFRIFQSPDGPVHLGFCGNDCEFAFCAGIEGIRHSQVVL